jgi:hypothetical protein
MHRILPSFSSTLTSEPTQLFGTPEKWFSTPLIPHEHIRTLLDYEVGASLELFERLEH